MQLKYTGKSRYFGLYDSQEKAVAVRTLVQSILNDAGSSESLSTKEFDKIVKSAELDDKHLGALSRKEIDRAVKFVRKAAIYGVSKRDTHNAAYVGRSSQEKSPKVHSEGRCTKNTGKKSHHKRHSTTKLIRERKRARDTSKDKAIEFAARDRTGVSLY